MFFLRFSIDDPKGRSIALQERRRLVVISSFLTIGILIGEPTPKAVRTLVAEPTGGHFLADASKQ
jgi:hypothetical protein